MKRSQFALAAAALALAACRPGSWSSGFADGNGAFRAVDREYARPAEEAWNALVAALKDYDLKIESDRHDALGGDLVATRANGERVTASARSLDRDRTQVAISVGAGDRNAAELLHEAIARKLGTGAAQTGLFGGSMVEGTYDAPVDRCLEAAQRAYETLGLPVTHRDVHDTWAHIDSRKADAIPVRVRAQRTEKDQTKVSFMVGTSPGDDNRMLAERLKTEFERSMPGTSDNRGGAPAPQQR